MNIVVLAPHPDDEVLSAFLFIKHLKNMKNNVSVVFATNGDYKGRHVAVMRAQESIGALSSIGITLKDIYFMGYADTGMREENSFLAKLYNSPAANIHSAAYSNKTYSPICKKTVHFLIHGIEAFYTRENFVNDLIEILQILKPHILIVPSKYDYHGDHRMLGLFVSEIIASRSNNELKNIVLSYLIHSCNDLIWPNTQNSYFSYPISSFPKIIWDNRVIFRFAPEERLQKKEIIRGFVTQSPSALDSFLYRFSKEEEIFFLENDFN